MKLEIIFGRKTALRSAGRVAKKVVTACYKIESRRRRMLTHRKAMTLTPTQTYRILRYHALLFLYHPTDTHADVSLDYFEFGRLTNYSKKRPATLNPIILVFVQDFIIINYSKRFALSSEFNNITS